MGDVIDKTHMPINKGNPLFARESKGNPPTGLIFDPSLLLFIPSKKWTLEFCRILKGSYSKKTDNTTSSQIIYSPG